MTIDNNPFWHHKTLSDLTSEEWEAVCDGCGRCCLYKLEDQDTGEIGYTAVACRLLDIEQCRCKDYHNRKALKKNCISLTPRLVEMISWLPETCAYRILSEGRDLPSWHPLVSGDPESVHAAGISLRNKAIPETFIDEEDFESYLIDIDC